MPSVLLMAQKQGQCLGTGLSPRWGPAEAGCLLLPHPGAKLPVAPGSDPTCRRALSLISKPLCSSKGCLNSLPCYCFGACAEQHLPPPAFRYCLPLAGATQPCPGPAAAQGPSGEPRWVFGCSPGSCVLAPGGLRPSLWLVLVRASTSQHLHLALASKRLALAARKEIKRCKGI